MIMLTHFEQVKQPDDEFFRSCKEATYLPFALRARVVNTFRRRVRCEIFGKNPTQPTRTKSAKVTNARPSYPRRKRFALHRHRSCNVVCSTTYVCQIVMTSGGRNRPSRNSKALWKTVSSVQHLTGTKGTWRAQHELDG